MRGTNSEIMIIIISIFIVVSSAQAEILTTDVK